MAIWHVTIGKYPVCEMPQALDLVRTCSHMSREAAREAARRLRESGRRNVRVVAGECPTSDAIANEK